MCRKFFHRLCRKIPCSTSKIIDGKLKQEGSQNKASYNQGTRESQLHPSLQGMYMYKNFSALGHCLRSSLTGRTMVWRRPSVCPSVCPGLVGRTNSPGSFDQHDETKMPVVFQGRRSKLKVVLSHSRKTSQAGYRLNHQFQDLTAWYN